MISTIYTRYAVLRRLKIKHCDLFFLLFLKKIAIIVFERKKRKVVMTMSILYERETANLGQIKKIITLVDGV